MAVIKSYGEYDIEDLHFGEYWELPLVYEDANGSPIDISGDRFYGTFRTGNDRKAASTLVLTFDSDAANETCEITDGPNGEFKIIVNQTNSTGFPKSKGIWDLWRIPAAPNDDKPDLLLKGKWSSEESATDWDTVTL
jgi:hypothetical protein